MRRVATVTAGAVLAVTVSAGAAAAADGPRMPDFRGRGLMHVFSTLDYRTRVEVTDVSGAHRHVLWPLSWKVCSQSPAVGKEVGDATVHIGVVKNGEKCPAAVPRAVPEAAAY
ncbi:hypothetical protein G3I40_21610 [Streptomyces sp. SID14478]|uniref:hypothetical protein n=1 Tax=Streptomyces sp. SID14478 TaxID=2706073 RepID=UPI0013DD7999|nr:hypothetical protein [Streptomyces sp. SID14478]NEB77791.1 hypothetical protein [Streptomyces sp. SID14478]